ncbi:unnamed protein product [Adineta ricciae]|nr:unnamed protein product [Adineta ricciae]
MYDDISSQFGNIISQTGMVTLVAVDDRQLSARMKTQTTTYTTTTSSTTTTVPQCNITACRMQIQSYIALNWTYDTINFHQCDGCSRANFSDFPPDWPNRWSIMNFHFYRTSDADCTGNPYIGNLKFCQKTCLKDITCVGFTRAKSAPDSNSNAACYLKKNITGAGVYNSAAWQTIVLNSTI